MSPHHHYWSHLQTLSSTPASTRASSSSSSPRSSMIYTPQSFSTELDQNFPSRLNWRPLRYKQLHIRGETTRDVRRLSTALSFIGNVAVAIEENVPKPTKGRKSTVNYTIRIASNSSKDTCSAEELQEIIDFIVTEFLQTDRKELRNGYPLALYNKVLKHVVGKRHRQIMQSVDRRPLEKWIDNLRNNGDLRRRASLEWKALTKNVACDMRERWVNSLGGLACGGGNKEKDDAEYAIRCVDEAQAILAEMAMAESVKKGIDGNDEDRLPGLLEGMDNLWKWYDNTNTKNSSSSRRSTTTARSTSEKVKDGDMLDPTDRRRGTMFLYLDRLGRYKASVHHILQFLANLRRWDHLRGRQFTAKPVSSFLATASASAKDEGNFNCFAEYLKKKFDIKIGDLDADKSRSIEFTWKNEYETQRRLYPEIQLALFYWLNPPLRPMANFLALNRYCSELSGQVLKGSFHIAGTDGSIPPDWLFPNLKLLLQSVSPPSPPNHTLLLPAFLRRSSSSSSSNGKSEFDKLSMAQYERLRKKLRRVRYNINKDLREAVKDRAQC